VSDSSWVSLQSSAVFSDCGKYRYLLTRRVGRNDRAACFIMLNPSTADADRDDPTIRKCIGFARRWGCGRLIVANLFALRATNPAELRRARDPVGPLNRTWIEEAVKCTVGAAYAADQGLVICAWGTVGSHAHQDRVALRWIESVCTPQTLGLTQDGSPKHPLYVPYGAEQVSFVVGSREMP
jgi:hypothetical protein